MVRSSRSEVGQGMRRVLLGVLVGAVATSGALAVGARAVGAAAPSISSVVLSGSPSAPTFTVSGAGFGTQPAPNPASAPCVAGSGQGRDYGTSLWMKDVRPLLGTERPWTAGLADPSAGQLSCIGLKLRSWTDTKVAFSPGANYDNASFRLTEGDLVRVVVKGVTFSFPAHFAGGVPQLPTEDWCDARVNSCASVYMSWLGTKASINQTVTVRHLARSSYAAMLWNDGYTGIQNDGNAVSGAVGPTAVFSLGGAGVLIHSTAKATCEPGFDSNPGASCRVPLPGPILDGTAYRFVVSRSATTGWITGKVVTPAGVTVTIGKLMPSFGAPTTFGLLRNFVEYFGPDTATTAVPRSSVNFARGQTMASQRHGSWARAARWRTTGPSAGSSTSGARAAPECPIRRAFGSTCGDADGHGPDSVGEGLRSARSTRRAARLGHATGDRVDGGVVARPLAQDRFDVANGSAA